MKLIGIHESAYTVDEAKGSVAGWPILGKVCGPSFFPGGISRNKRLYPEELWNGVLANESVITRLHNGTIFGTIGHDLDIDEKALREGLVSHITKVMEYRTKNGTKIGYCEHYIIDTDVGRRLYTYLKAGANLYVSSRADGDYAGHTDEGIPILGADSYVFERFDFVLDPGFLEANPKLLEGMDHKVAESVKSSLSKLSKIEEIMADKINEPLKTNVPGSITTGSNAGNLSDGNVQLPPQNVPGGIDAGINADNLKKVENPTSIPIEVDDRDPKTGYPGLIESSSRKLVSELLASNKKLREDNDALMNIIPHDDTEAIKELTGCETKAEGLLKIRKFMEEIGSLDDAECALKMADGKFDELGEPAAIAEALANANKFFEEVGEPEAVKDALVKADDFFDSTGTPGEIKDVLENVTEYFNTVGEPEAVKASLEKATALIDNVGSPEQIEKAMTESLSFHNKYGTSQEIRETLEGMRAVSKELGSVSEIRDALTGSKDRIKVLENRVRTLELSKATGIDEAKLAPKINAGMSDNDIYEHFQVGGAGRATDPILFRENRTVTVGSKVGPNSGKGLMSEAFGKTEGGSRLTRMMEGRKNG